MNRRQAAFDLLKGANPVPVPDQENDAVPIRRPVPTLLTSAVVAVVALVLVGVFLNPLNNDQEPATPTNSHTRDGSIRINHHLSRATRARSVSVRTLRRNRDCDRRWWRLSDRRRLGSCLR